MVDNGRGQFKLAFTSSISSEFSDSIRLQSIITTSTATCATLIGITINGRYGFLTEHLNLVEFFPAQQQHEQWSQPDQPSPIEPAHDPFKPWIKSESVWNAEQAS